MRFGHWFAGASLSFLIYILQVWHFRLIVPFFWTCLSLLDRHVWLLLTRIKCLEALILFVFWHVNLRIIESRLAQKLASWSYVFIVVKGSDLFYPATRLRLSLLLFLLGVFSSFFSLVLIWNDLLIVDAISLTLQWFACLGCWSSCEITQFYLLV